jgi:NADH dehydrogenase
MGVEVKLNVSVQQYDSGIITLSDGTTIEAETLIWSAGVKGAFPEGLDASHIGRSNRLKVNHFLQLQGQENVWVVGDVALVEGDAQYPNGHPMVAPVAVQQAKCAATNLMNQAANKPLQVFQYRDRGSMATIGRHRAVLESMGIRLKGFTAWLGWMFLHLMLLVGFRSRLVVFINWVWNYLSYQRAIRLITRKEVITER